MHIRSVCCNWQNSGAPIGCVVLNGKQYEPDSLEPLLNDLSEKHPDLDIEKVNADGIFNSQPLEIKCKRFWERMLSYSHQPIQGARKIYRI